MEPTLVKTLKVLGWSAAGIAVAAIALLFGVEIDGVLGLVARHDLRTIQRLSTPSGSTVEQLISKRFKNVKWKAYHFDELYRTVVDCEASSAAGETVTFSWEVGHFFSPHPKLERKRLFLCALTREAAELTPWLTPPGYPPNRYPPQEARVFRSTALYGDLGK